MRALITGGAGFVGRHLTHRLLKNGWDVFVVDNLIEGSGAISPIDTWPLFQPLDFENFHFLKMDCRKFFVENSNEYYDYIFHLAAVVGGRLTIEKNPLAVASDLSIDADMWNWALSAQVGKVVNFSSSAAYPVHFQESETDVIRLTEDMINFKDNLGLPDLTYGWAKLTSEYTGKIAWERNGIKSVVYRPFSGYGPDQDLSYPFPSICKRVIEMEGSHTFKVWGSGKQCRDFIHIDDCIEGVLKTMDLVHDGDAINLSTGIPTSFIDFALLATNLVGYTPEIIGDIHMPTGVSSRVGDTSKQSLYGFCDKRPFIDGIREGLDFLNSSSKS